MSASDSSTTPQGPPHRSATSPDNGFPIIDTETSANPAAPSPPQGKAKSKPKRQTKSAPAAPAKEKPHEPAATLAKPRRSWRNLWFASESWGGSIAVHLLLLIILSLLTLAGPRREEPNQIISVIERPEEQLHQMLDEQLAAATAVSLASASGPTSQTHGDPLDAGEMVALDSAVSDALSAPAVSLADTGLRVVPSEQLTSHLTMESPGDPSSAVEGYGAAMDRITQELVLMLSKSKVLVVWLMARTASMDDERQEIAERIDRVYAELGLSSGGDDDSLLTTVVSFATQPLVHAPKPTSNIDAIRKAFQSMPEDESGEEMMCRAIMETIREYRRWSTRGGRQLAVIVLCDESGDDGEDGLLEPTIQMAKEANCRIYCLGREACFGYPYIYKSWTWVNPDDPKDKIPGIWLPMRLGPETAFVEQLQHNGLWRRHDYQSSGFGGYEQVRLCRETGGIFFILPSEETNLVRATGVQRIYELEAMRPYMPDLRGREEYLAEREANELRRVIWDVIGTLNPWQVDELNLLRDFSISPEQFSRQVQTNQRRAAVLIGAYEAAEKRLAEFQRARDQEPSPRWRANYDLLFAQVVAYQPRLHEYGAYLNAFLQNPKAKKDSKSNHWRIDTRKQTTGDERVEAMIERATELLKAVIDEHPGTPYAARAQWELARGFGIELNEIFLDPRRDTVERPKL